MIDLPSMPPKCKISADCDGQGVLLRWSNQQGGCMRYFVVSFFSLWLILYALGVCTTLTQLDNGDSLKGGKFDLFMLFFIGVIGVLSARPVLFPRKESVQISDDALTYTSGASNIEYPVPFDFAADRQLKRYISNEMFARSKPRTFSRKAITGITLETWEQAQHLYLELGADRIEIGRYLRESDREWLADELQRWLKR
jgi:hypothetical protein